MRFPAGIVTQTALMPIAKRAGGGTFLDAAVALRQVEDPAVRLDLSQHGGDVEAGRVGIDHQVQPHRSRQHATAS